MKFVNCSSPPLSFSTLLNLNFYQLPTLEIEVKISSFSLPHPRKRRQGTMNNLIFYLIKILALNFKGTFLDSEVINPETNYFWMDEMNI